MPVFFLSLNSGSNGNAYLVGDGRQYVMIDAGLPCRTTLLRLKEAGISPRALLAIFLSHEHIDHIRGVQGLTRKWHLPVYVSPETLRYASVKPDLSLVRFIDSEADIEVGPFRIHPFRKSHDAADPFSFSVTCEDHRIGIFTDLGRVCDSLRHHFSRCDAAFLESNYDEEMLEKGPYPVWLKERVRGPRGHLSNNEALELFLHHRSPGLRHLILSHLSEKNNHPDKVQHLFQPLAGDTQVHIASRHRISPLFQLEEKKAAEPLAPPLTLF